MNDIIKKISRKENIPAGDLKKGVENGTVVIPLNNKRKNHIERPAAIGSGLSVKVNANIGASPDINDVQTELEKLRVSTMAGADTVMDLTISRDWEKILREVILNSAVPVGTVPVYGAVCSKSNIYELNERDFIDIVEKQAQMGVDFMTIHAGVTRKTARAYDESCRVGGMVSRGGKLLYRWMKNKERENPFYNCFDEVLKIASEYSVTISLGDGLRPGSIIDASDGAQYCELEVLGELSQRCMDAGVMVMIEGPGHVPIDKIKENISKEKKICNGAPFYVLGPLTTDIGAGYDHITSAIGGALAGYMGADFLCYVTPAEHMHLPGLKDVKEGVIASKIAAHSADLARGRSDYRDRKMSEARRRLDWKEMEKYALDPEKIREARKKYPSLKENACTMCGSYCALADEEI